MQLKLVDYEETTMNEGDFQSKKGVRYSRAHRIESMNNYVNGIPTMASQSSIYRWRKRLDDLPPSGNHHTNQKITGEYEELLKFYRLAYPLAHLHV